MRIVFDCMGADSGVEAILRGITLVRQERAFDAVLVGDEKMITAALEASSKELGEVEVIGASSWITNEEEPALALRRKKDASVAIAMKYLAQGDADALISAGSTGGLLAAATFLLGRLEGVSRACLPTRLPSATGGFLLVDSGANMDATTEQLKNFATLGATYMRDVGGVASPKIGLLNVGTEPGKGNAQTKAAYEALQDLPGFVGNVEARELFIASPDVVVADGFVGNILLKNTEGVAMFLMGMLKKHFEKLMQEDEVAGKTACLVLRELSKHLDYKEVGATPLLGVKAPVLKAHGASDAKAFASAIRQAMRIVERNLMKEMEKEQQGGISK